MMTVTDTTTNAALPHPRWRLPVLGDLLTINPVKPTQTSMADAQRLGPIFERRIVDWPLVVVSGPDLIAEINDETNWAKHVGVVFKKMRPIVRDGLFTAYNHEPNWAKAHRILAPAFTKQAMQNYHDTMGDVAAELVETWSAHDDWITDVAEDMNRFTLEVIARCGFDHSFGSFDRSPGEEHPLVAALMRSLYYINRNSNLPPLLQKTIGRRPAAQHRKDVVYAKTVVDEIVAARKREPDPGAHGDLLSLMLTTADPESGEQLDDANVRNQILTFIVAGHETSAGALAFAMHYLAAHPEIAAAARAEVDARFAGRDRLGYDDVAKMRYLRRVVDETLRLWPVAPGYFREARRDVTIGDGRYHFTQGDWVLVLTLQAHRDPATWGEDADSFDPDRWLPARARSLDGNVYRPFGTGMRACIGRQFAYHEILLGLAHLLRAFEFDADPDYRLDVAEQITLKPAGLRIRAQPRRAGPVR